MLRLPSFVGLLASTIHTASATLPSSPRFDLTAPSYDLFRSEPLADATVQQGFAFDNGDVVQGPTLTKAGSSLSFREPEGLAIYQTDAGETRLFLGFASGESGDRRSNMFYKNALV